MMLETALNMRIPVKNDTVYEFSWLYKIITLDATYLL